VEMCGSCRFGKRKQANKVVNLPSQSRRGTV